MAGIYIHIPFCKSRCNYCDFYSSVDIHEIDNFVDALCYEIKTRKDEAIFEIETIYLGGGTPSLLNNKQLEKIFYALHNHYSLNKVKEITIEVNPDDITSEKLQFYKQIGINRISIGVQSLDDNVLKILSRRHNSKQAIETVYKSLEAGIENISIDLIYGINEQTEQILTKTSLITIKLPIKHISAYHLTIEEGTKLHSKFIKKEYLPVTEENSITHYELLCNILRKANFEHYEISNFSLPGYKSIHNSSYWNFEPYLGFGPSAHSFYSNTRRENYSSLKFYIKNINEGKEYYKLHCLSEKDKFNEFIMVKLRTNIGIKLNQLPQIQKQLYFKFTRTIEKLILEGLLLQENNRIYISSEKWILSDYIIRELFV